MDTLRSEKLLARKSSDRFGTLSQVLARFGIWLLMAVAVVGVLWGAHLGMRKVFFTANPHFVVTKVDVEIVNGNLDEEAVLDRINLRLGETNLYAVNLAEVRGRLLGDPIIRQAEVRRVLPDTLSVRVYGRTPVAQLLRTGGLMIDKDGVVLPPANRPDFQELPIVTPIARFSTYKVGDPIKDPSVVAALELLQILSTEPRGKWMDVQLIHLHDAESEMQVYLRENTDCLVPPNAMFVLPMKDVPTAVDRALLIIGNRSKNGQRTRRINLTYEHVPIEP